MTQQLAKSPATHHVAALCMAEGGHVNLGASLEAAAVDQGEMAMGQSHRGKGDGGPGMSEAGRPGIKGRPWLEKGDRAAVGDGDRVEGEGVLVRCWLFPL